MITKSLFSLTKYNNGFFKSEKQKAFILAQCQETGVYYSKGGFVYNNSYRHAFLFDSQGVICVQKITKNKTVTTWERQSHDEYQKELTKRLEKAARVKAVNRLYDVACAWTEKAEKYKKDKIVSRIEAGDYDEAVLRRKVKVYHSITRKVERINQAYVELVGTM